MTDPAVVISRLAYRYKVFMPKLLAEKDVLLGPFNLNVHGSQHREFSVIWRRKGPGRCEVLVWSMAEGEAVSGQLRLTVNDQVKLLEPHCRCTWADADAAGFAFQVSGHAKVTVDVVQTSKGLLRNQLSKLASPPSLAHL